MHIIWELDGTFLATKMHYLKRWFTGINLVGGTLVLGSYAWGLRSRPEAGRVLWGGVPETIQFLSRVSMLAAALGYIAFTLFILMRVDAERCRVFGHRGFGTFNILYAAILFPSALWMPLTFAAVDAGTSASAWVVRVLLALIGLASLGLLYALLTVEPVQSEPGHRLAVLGSALFCLQTVVLDAVVWSMYFTA
jgi:hypothetical protein